MLWFLVGVSIGAFCTTVLFLIWLALMADNWDRWFPCNCKSKLEPCADVTVLADSAHWAYVTSEERNKSI
jgi:hypothetical protein